MHPIPGYRRYIPALLQMALLCLSVSIHAQDVSQKNRIPPASLPCSDEEKQWWEKLRQSGDEVIEAVKRKETALNERRRGKHKIPDDQDELLSKNDRERLNSAITTSTEKYLGVLQEGKQKSYRIPVPDGRPILLYRVLPRFTDAASKAKVNGEIAISLVFQSDGTISEPKITRGLGFGLDEKAIEIARKLVFLPAVKNGVFITDSSNLVFTFASY